MATRTAAPTMRYRLLLAVAAALLLAACGSAPPLSPSPRAVAMAYLRKHPVQPVHGMVAGVILTLDDVGFLGDAARAAHCPATLTAAITRAAGDLPACGAWSATAETASGYVLHLSCGSIPGRHQCPLMLLANGYIPTPGDYVRFRADGQITTPADIQVIREFAVGELLQEAPDPGGPVFATRSAAGA